MELKGVSLCSLAYCHPSGGTRVGVMLPWCEDGNVLHCPLIFICEAVWLLPHTFSEHLGNPLAGIPLSPPLPWF